RRAVAALWPGWTGPIIGLVPASRKGTREWPAERYAELARRLAASAGARCVVFWGPGEEETARAVAAAAPGAAKASPKTADLKCLGALLSACRLVVTNCNGPKHIAVARGVPTVTVHGSSDPVCWNPPQPGPKGPESPLGHPRHLVVRRDELSCIGCRQNDCPLGTTECLRDLSAERVERAALSLLGAEAKLP
ncbi:MAG: glycosyltransferase family 9 protein, partial [Elusimicrobia bacterium]|nr:glycosyltransferase family 9 protein [Elusimicrobiota bacterium]